MQYSSPDPDYHGSSPRRSQKAPHDPNNYYPPPPDPAVNSTGMCEVEGKELYYIGTDFLVRKSDLLKEMAKLQTTNEKIEFLTFLI